MFEKEAEVYATQFNFYKQIFAKKSFLAGAKFGYNKANEYAKTIIQDLLDNSDEYARQRAMDFLEED